MQNVFTLFLAALLALPAAALELVSPKEGEEVCALNPAALEFLSKSREGRRAQFLDKAWRKYAAKEVKSDAVPIKLVWKDAEGPCEVRVDCGGRTVFATNAAVETANVWNLEIARTYKWSVKDARGTVRAGTFRTRDLAPRVIHLPGAFNVRDLGGRIGLYGRRVRQGLVYRSGGLNCNANTWLSCEETLALYKAGKLEEKYGKDGLEVKRQIEKEKGRMTFDPLAPFLRKSLKRPNPTKGKERLSDETKRYAREVLGIKSDIDLRSDMECWGMTGSPLGPTVTWYHIPSSAYASMAEKKGKEAFKKVFRLFLDEKNYPIDFHCIGGADRTGAVGFILNALLGVSDEELDKDWEITCFAYEAQAFGHESRFDKLRAVFNRYPGATTREKVESYVKELGFGDADIATFRNIMLEK